MRLARDRRSWGDWSWPARRRPGAVLGLAYWLTSLLGCQTVSRQAGSNPPEVASASAAKLDPQVAAAEFSRDVTPDQQFNVHIELGRVYESQQEYTAALDEYQKALEACTRRGFGSGSKAHGTKQALAHRRMGGALDRLGRFAQAEDHYRLALKASPDDAKVWNDSGYSYYLQSRWADAERNLKTAAKLAPDDVRVQTNLGLTLAAMGKTDEALLALTKAGGSAVAHANLGYLLAALGRNDEAKEHYRKAVELQPNLAAARQALATLDAGGRRPDAVAGAPTGPVQTRPGTNPTPALVADADVKRTTGPSVTPVSISPLLPGSPLPK